MTRMLAIAGLALAAIALGTGAAGATELVDDDKQQCPSAAHTTVQAGVSAASPGEQVLVCNGLYQETVRVIGPDKDGVQLVANATQRATIKAPFDYSGPVVEIINADRVQVRRFTITGPFQSASGGCPPGGLNRGVDVTGGAIAALVSDNRINAISDAQGGSCEPGDGIAVYVTYGGRVTVARNTIVNYQHTGVNVLNPGSFAAIDSNTITAGTGHFGQQGIVVAGDAQATILTNQISQNGFGDPSFGQGIVLVSADDQGVRVSGNRLFRNDLGILIGLQQGALVSYNTAFDNSEGGIDVRDGTRNIKLERNDLRGNGGFDCQDDTAGDNPGQPGFPRYTTLNLWVNNKGLDADPGPICTPSGVAGPPVP